MHLKIDMAFLLYDLQAPEIGNSSLYVLYSWGSRNTTGPNIFSLTKSEANEIWLDMLHFGYDHVINVAFCFWDQRSPHSEG